MAQPPKPPPAPPPRPRPPNQPPERADYHAADLTHEPPEDIEVGDQQAKKEDIAAAKMKANEEAAEATKTIGDEQRARSAEMVTMGLEAWRKKYEPPSPAEEEAKKVVAGVAR
jgi:hypothetical protein